MSQPNVFAHGLENTVLPEFDARRPKPRNERAIEPDSKRAQP